MYKTLQHDFTKKRELRTKCRYFLQLIKNHSTVQAASTFLLHKRIVKAQKTLQEFRKITLIRATWKRACAYLQAVHVERSAKLALAALKTHTHRAKERVYNSELAVSKMSSVLELKCLKGLQSYMKEKLNGREHRIRNSIRAHRRKLVKTQLICMWKKKARKALLKVKGVMLMAKALKKLALSKYRREIKGLKDLIERIAIAKEIFKMLVIFLHHL